MQTWKFFAAALLGGICALSVSPAGAQQPGMKLDVFKTVKVGQWVQIEGVPQKDFTVMATEIKFLTGDFKEDDWEVFGAVRRVDKLKKEFEIMLLKVKPASDADFESSDPNTRFTSFDGLKPGMLVEVEGSYLKDGTFLADEVQDETKTKADLAGEVKLIGKVEKFDQARQSITMMGITFHVIDKTQAKSAMK